MARSDSCTAGLFERLQRAAERRERDVSSIRLFSVACPDCGRVNPRIMGWLSGCHHSVIYHYHCTGCGAWYHQTTTFSQVFDGTSHPIPGSDRRTFLRDVSETTISVTRHGRMTPPREAGGA